jgi:uncharacterized DUF497 family protein
MPTIIWDEPKRLANLAKHGFDFAGLNDEFFLSAVIVTGHSNRLVAIGRFGGVTVTVVFVHLGTEGVSVISMRQADRKERRLLP